MNGSAVFHRLLAPIQFMNAYWLYAKTMKCMILISPKWVLLSQI